MSESTYDILWPEDSRSPETLLLQSESRISALEAERDALALQVQRARDDALEEAALVCDNEVAQARAHNCTTEAIGALWSAKAIRALRGATEGAGG